MHKDIEKRKHYYLRCDRNSNSKKQDFITDQNGNEMLKDFSVDDLLDLKLDDDDI